MCVVVCRNVLPKVKTRLNFEQGISVLDVGCGSGAWMTVTLDN